MDPIWLKLNGKVKIIKYIVPLYIQCECIVDQWKEEGSRSIIKKKAKNVMENYSVRLKVTFINI